MAKVWILGAGFSKPAGLPLGVELFARVVSAARGRRVGQGSLYENTIAPHVEHYRRYREEARGVSHDEDIDFEDFMSFLDIEHFLKLRGNDHWSEEGNRSQIVVRNLIALVLHEAQKNMFPEGWELYEEWARSLGSNDQIVTFNYDTIVEAALHRTERPFRRTASYDSDLESKEIMLLRMHGSIDWFDIGPYDFEVSVLRDGPMYCPPRHPVFASQGKFTLQKLVLEDGYPRTSGLTEST